MDAATVHNNYMKQLQSWSHNVKWHQWMWNEYVMVQNMALHSQLLNHRMRQQDTAQHTASSTSTSTQLRSAAANNQFQEFQIPSMARRAAAEISDFFLLLLFKTVLLLVMLYYFNLDFSFDIQPDGLLDIKFVKIISDGEEDKIFEESILNNFFKDDSGSGNYVMPLEDHVTIMLLITCAYRLISILYETFFIWCFGATPGKDFFGIQVVSCDMNSPGVSSGTVAVFPGRAVSACSAWMRSVIKNISIAFLIPAFATAFFYAHQRASYDIMSNTIVVKKNRQLRRGR